MGTTADKLSYLNDTKEALKTSINNFDDSVASISDETTFRDYATKVDEANTFTNDALSGYEAQLTEILGEVPIGETPKDIIVNALAKVGQTVNTSNSWDECAEAIKDTRDYLDPSWVHIDEILEADTGIDGLEYATNLIFIEAAIDPSTTITMDTTCIGVKTSDGHEYTYANDGSSITHVWDQEQEFTDSMGNKYRWIIEYFADKSYITTSLYTPARIEWICFGRNFVMAASNFRYYFLLRAITGLDARLSFSGSIYAFLYSCYSLQYVMPLDFTNVTNFQQWATGTLATNTVDMLIPSGVSVSSTNDIFNLSRRYIINNGGEYVYPSGGSLYFRSAGVTCIYGYLDATACTAVDFSFNSTLVHFMCKFPDLSVDIQRVTSLSFQSLTYLCDNISATTTNTITLGTTLQTRAGQDNLDKLIAKGWTIA